MVTGYEHDALARQLERCAEFPEIVDRHGDAFDRTSIEQIASDNDEMRAEPLLAQVAREAS
jgi:hypothetical protein